MNEPAAINVGVLHWLVLSSVRIAQFCPADGTVEEKRRRSASTTTTTEVQLLCLCVPSSARFCEEIVCRVGSS